MDLTLVVCCVVVVCFRAGVGCKAAVAFICDCIWVYLLDTRGVALLLS